MKTNRTTTERGIYGDKETGKENKVIQMEKSDKYSEVYRVDEKDSVREVANERAEELFPLEALDGCVVHRQGIGESGR